MENNFNMENTNGFNIANVFKALEQTAAIVGENAKATASILNDLKDTKVLVASLSKDIKNVQTDYSALTERMTNLEENEEITTEQHKTIRTAAHRRIFEIMGDDKYKRAKYFRGFITRLYMDAKTFSGLGNSIPTTRKRDFQRVIDYIESWTPTYGCRTLMRDLDEMAAARKKAKEEGYDA